MIYTPSQTAILQALGRYKFLTISLLDKLGILNHKVSIYRAIKPLKEGKRPLVIAQSFGVNPRHGKLEDILYLSKWGKSFLINEHLLEESKIKAPNTKALVSSDYFHRLRTIEFYICLDMVLKGFEDDLTHHIELFDYYFDKSKNKAKNRIDIDKEKYIIPDGVVKFRYKDRVNFYLFEQHNGKDIVKIMVQVLHHCLALQNMATMKKYNLKKNNRVVIVFEFEQVKDTVIKRAKEDNSFSQFKDYFLLKSNSNLDPFFSGWENLYGEKCEFCVQI